EAGAYRAGRILDRSKHDAADLDRPVVPGAKQIDGRHACKGADFMVCRRAAVEKEALHGLQRGCAEILENAEAKTLCNRRIDRIENGIRPCALDPPGAAVREQPAARGGKLGAGIAFGSFQASRKWEIRKQVSLHDDTCAALIMRVHAP